jgi:bifunctional non-homologous end joining protein LigD
LRGKSFLIDGEAVACDATGLALLQRLRTRNHDGTVILYAFDLIEFNGEDLRKKPLEDRKRLLGRILHGGDPGIHNSDCVAGDGSSI